MAFPATRVIDLSHWNTVPDTLEATAMAGVWGMIHKCTEGKTVADDKYEARKYLAAQAGMLFGAYHFLRPGDMRMQAMFFVDTAKLGEGSGSGGAKILLAADHEDRRVSLKDLARFLENVELLSGRLPVIYSGHVLKEQIAAAGGMAAVAGLGLARYPLWLAQYGPAAVVPPGWPGWWLWQFTDKGIVPGVAGDCDCNAYAGERGDLTLEWVVESVLGAGSVPDDADEIVVRVSVPPGVRVVVTEEDG